MGSPARDHDRNGTGSGRRNEQRADRDNGGTLACGGYAEIKKSHQLLIGISRQLGSHLGLRGRWLTIEAYDFDRERTERQRSAVCGLGLALAGARSLLGALIFSLSHSWIIRSFMYSLYVQYISQFRSRCRPLLMKVPSKGPHGLRLLK